MVVVMSQCEAMPLLSKTRANLILHQFCKMFLQTGSHNLAHKSMSVFTKPSAMSIVQGHCRLQKNLIGTIVLVTAPDERGQRPHCRLPGQVPATGGNGRGGLLHGNRRTRPEDSEGGWLCWRLSPDERQKVTQGLAKRNHFTVYIYLFNHQQWWKTESICW